MFLTKFRTVRETKAPFGTTYEIELIAIEFIEVEVIPIEVLDKKSLGVWLSIKKTLLNH